MNIVTTEQSCDVGSVLILENEQISMNWNKLGSWCMYKSTCVYMKCINTTFINAFITEMLS